MKRCCDVIIAVDAEADPGMSFDSLLKLERYARIDLGATVNLPWQKISKQALSLNNVIAEMRDSSGIPPLLGPHCAACEIEYGSKQGILLYIKASLNGDEADYILDYKYRNQESA
jgi:hypothetical protein